MPNTKPLVAAALICERVLREESDVLSAIRIVDTYKTKLVKMGLQPPTDEPTIGEPPPGAVILDLAQVLDMSALVILKAGDVSGQHEISLIIRNPEGKETRYPQTFPVIFAKNDPAEGAQLIARFVMPGNTKSGLYWIDVLWDGDVLTSIPLKLIRESESQGVA